MAKLKDGFYKLTASSIGSDLYVLLAGGGSKPISDFALASDYVNLTGALTISGVKTFSTLQKFTVAKGTSPFTVTSSTLVTNLNANYASELTSTPVSDPAKAYSTSNHVTWYTGGSTNTGSSGYMGNNYGFPVSNNANGILWLGTHSGPHGGLLGVSSNGGLYYRFITRNSFPTTANGGSWNRVAWVSDIPTKTSQLTNNSGFWTGTKYWANLEVGGSSNTSTTPTFGAFVRLNSSISGAGGDVYLEWWRGTNASWRALNNAGTLKFQCNYTSTTGSYYDAFRIDYNSGNSWIKGNLNVVGSLAGSYGATRAFYAGGGNTYVWIDSRDTSSNVKNSILLYDDRTSTKTLAPHVSNTYSLGTSSLRWSNIYSYAGNFSSVITSNASGAILNACYDGTNYSNIIYGTSSGIAIFGSPKWTKVILETTPEATGAYRQTNGVKYKILDEGNFAYTWNAITTKSAWSRIMNMGSNSNVILTISFAQNTLACSHTYFINTNFDIAKIAQIMYGGFLYNSNPQVRVTKSSQKSFHVEVYNTYGYNGATTISFGCKAILAYGSMSTISAYTAGGGTICDSVTSSNRVAKNFYVEHSVYTDLLKSHDTRKDTITPSTFDNGFRVHFQANGTNGVNDGGSYYGLIHIKHYGNAYDHSGGYPHQIAFTPNNNLWHRIGTSASEWGSWIKILDSNNYAVTLDSRYYTKSEAESRFINASGDTMTGILYIGDSNHFLQYHTGGKYIELYNITASTGIGVWDDGKALVFNSSGLYEIWHTGNLNMGLNTITKSLKVTTSWQNTGITGADIGTGAFVVRIGPMSDYRNGGSHYAESYVGLMCSYADTTNSTVSDEIPLHRCGHALNSSILYLRTIRTSSSGYVQLQIAGNYNMSAALNITFTFRRII